MDSSISEFGQIQCCRLGFQSKINKKIASIVDPDQVAHYETSHLALHCSQRYRQPPLYRTRYNDKIRYNNNLTVTNLRLRGNFLFQIMQIYCFGFLLESPQ